VAETDASEKLFQEAVLHLAQMNGWQHFHPSPAQKRPGVWRTDGQGFPDLVLAHHDRGVIFAELKTATGKMSPGQRVWEYALYPHVEWHLWRPSDLPRIAERLGPKGVPKLR